MAARKSKKRPAKAAAALTPEQGYEIIADVFERVSDEQHDRLLYLILSITAISRLVNDNTDFWTSHMKDALERVIPKSDAHNRSRKKPEKITLDLVRFVEERLSRLTIDEAIDEALKLKDWKGKSHAMVRRRYTRNRMK